jgi:hypothetical protein
VLLAAACEGSERLLCRFSRPAVGGPALRACLPWLAGFTAATSTAPCFVNATVVPIRRLLSHDVISTLATLLRSTRRASRVCGLRLVTSLAGCADAVSGGSCVLLPAQRHGTGSEPQVERRSTRFVVWLLPLRFDPAQVSAELLTPELLALLQVRRHRSTS